MKIDFVKMSGSGNDFIIIDNRNEKYLSKKEKEEFIRKYCKRRSGIGADGLLFLENSNKLDFKMRYYNSDGGEVEFCGNGARCISLFANKLLGYPNKMDFESIAGDIHAEVSGRNVKIEMPLVNDVKGPQEIDIDGEIYVYYYAIVGVPHVVIFVDNIKNVDVHNIGKAIRDDERFKPVGTNVNFASIYKNIDEYDIVNRTYEKGVEEETLACGTGVTAVAVIANNIYNIKSPVKVKVALPDILTIHIENDKRPFLEGEVELIYRGYVETESKS